MGLWQIHIKMDDYAENTRAALLTNIRCFLKNIPRSIASFKEIAEMMLATTNKIKDVEVLKTLASLIEMGLEDKQEVFDLFKAEVVEACGTVSPVVLELTTL